VIVTNTLAYCRRNKLHPYGPVSLNFILSVRNSVAEKASVFVIVSHFLLTETNALAYYPTELITAVISFMIDAPGVSLLGVCGFNDE
jgi:hypothetical protein